MKRQLAQLKLTAAKDAAVLMIVVGAEDWVAVTLFPNPETGRLIILQQEYWH